QRDVRNSGVTVMQVTENQDGRCRRVYWDLPDQGWEDLARQLDPFLAISIQAIATEYADDCVEWLVINRWPDSGRVLVYPAQDGPNGNRGEKIFFDLSSAYLENEFSRIGELVSGHERSLGWTEVR